mmetsp:Transcript_23202/g.64906  ORF Transcript_23202/g.64906 Transcript_23202/m.64906 type:complete len:370 (+) Transcript_23202:462-1571(+)
MHRQPQQGAGVHVHELLLPNLRLVRAVLEEAEGAYGHQRLPWQLVHRDRRYRRAVRRQQRRCPLVGGDHVVHHRWQLRQLRRGAALGEAADAAHEGRVAAVLFRQHRRVGAEPRAQPALPLQGLQGAGGGVDGLADRPAGAPAPPLAVPVAPSVVFRVGVCPRGAVGELPGGPAGIPLAPREVLGPPLGILVVHAVVDQALRQVRQVPRGAVRAARARPRDQRDALVLPVAGGQRALASARRQPDQGQLRVPRHAGLAQGQAVLQQGRVHGVVGREQEVLEEGRLRAVRPGGLVHRRDAHLQLRHGAGGLDLEDPHGCAAWRAHGHGELVGSPAPAPLGAGHAEGRPLARARGRPGERRARGRLRAGEA